MAKKKFTINLLSEKKFERTKIGRIVLWAVSIGRYLVIGTELIVITAFLSRFYFDRVLTDLNEEIAQKQAVIESFAEIESKVETTQQRIKTAKSLLTGQLRISNQLNKLAKTTPPDVAFESLAIDKKQARVSGSALSKQGVANFLTALKISPDFTNLNVGKLSSKPSQKEIDFDLSIGFKEDKNGL